MADEMVERLAEKWDSYAGSDEWLDADPVRDVRFLLNAIAAELPSGPTFKVVGYWLRAQASTEENDDG